MDELVVGALADVTDYLTDLKAHRGTKMCCEVARVYAGVQPGDMTGSSGNKIRNILSDLDGLRSHRDEFVFDLSERSRGETGPPVRITYWNQAVIDNISKYTDLPNRFKNIKMAPVSGYRARVEGMFYGFPECCTDTWILENDIGADVIGSLAYRVRRVFGDLRAERRERDGALRDMKRYIEHVPCKATCQQTIRMIERYKQVHEFVDGL